jgi:hypothetical protein
MLDTLGPLEDTVFAVGDPRTALAIYLCHFSSSASELKLVTYNEHTRAAWQCVRANRVIFWAPARKLEVFKQARMLGTEHGWVSAQPTIHVEGLRQQLLRVSAETFLGQVEKFARPWPEAFARWIVDENKLDASLLQSALNELAPDHEERACLLDAFPQRAKTALQRCLLGRRTTRTIMINRTQVMEDDNGWFASGGPQPEMICDATIRVDTEVIDSDMGTIHWEGAIRFRYRELPFRDEVEQIRADTRTWLCDKLRDACMGLPMVSSRWAPHLFSMAQQFGSPRRITGTSKVGLRPDGTVREEARPPSDVGVPASGVEPPRQRGLTRRDRPSITRDVVHAMQAGFVSLMLAALRETQPILLVGPPGSLARSVGRRFATQAGMPIRSISRKDMCAEKLRNKVSAGGYPVLLEPSMPGLLRHWSNELEGAFFLMAEADEAAALCTGRAWTVLEASEIVAPDLLPPFDDVIWYLCDLQRRDWWLPETGGLPESLVRDLCTWYDDNVQSEGHIRLAGPEARLYTAKPVDAMIELFYWLYGRGLVKLEYEAFASSLRTGSPPQGKAQALMDLDAGLVFVDRRGLEAAVRKAKLPPLDVEGVTHALLAQGLLEEPGLAEGWILPKDFWEARLNRRRRRLDAGT